MDQEKVRRTYRQIEQLKKEAEPPPREDNMTKTKATTTTPKATKRSEQAQPQPPASEVKELRQMLEIRERELGEARKEVEALKEKADELRLSLDRVTSRLRVARTDQIVENAVLRLIMEGLHPTDHDTRGFSWKEIGHGRVGGPYYYIANKWVNHGEAFKFFDCLTDRGAAPTAVQSPNQHGL